MDFVDNQVDKSTGTLRLRGVLDNPQGLLSAGMFARIRVPMGNPHEAILVPEEALGSDQGSKFVYVVGTPTTKWPTATWTSGPSTTVCG